MSINLSLVVIISSLLACNTNNRCKEGTHSSNRISPTEVIQDIPTKEVDSLQQVDPAYVVIKRHAVELQLDTPELGFDSLQIRIWLGHSMAEENHVIILRKTAEHWCAERIRYKKIVTDNSGEKLVDYKESQIIYPKSGWDHFNKQLSELQILTLPNADNLPGYNGCGDDGIGYFFEISTLTNYRFYYYCNPTYNSGKFWQAQNVIKFANVLEDEFQFRFNKGA